MITEGQSCPMDGTKVNEPVVRTVAILTAILAAAGTFLSLPLIYLLLIYDFFVRGFVNRKYSVIRVFGILINDIIEFKPKLIDGAPKQFAAKIGFVFSVSIFVLLLLQFTIAAYAVTAILLVCALLEGVLGFCVGCEFYFLLHGLGIIKTKLEDPNDYASL